ncbi:oligoendopeptidase F [Bacteroidota bacterium]|nr:oligoendopeptidase F [Bacteroidota bacterium]
MSSSFIPNPFVVQSKDDVIPLFESLLVRSIANAQDFEQFLQNVSDLESALSEDMAWRYIKMTCDTQNKDHETSYLTFVQEIQPHLSPLEDQLNRKIVNSPFAESLRQLNEGNEIYIRGLKGAVEIFREENIPIQSELATLAQEYSSIQGNMSIEWEGQTNTLQQASNILMQTDRQKREQVWHLMQKRRSEDTDKLNKLFNKMVQLRHQLAVNAGFENFRDYMFKAMDRYDYDVEACKDFHRSVETAVVPMLKSLMLDRKTKMRLASLKPWDTAVDPLGREPLKPFHGGAQLLEKGIDCLERVDPYFGDCLKTMKSNNLLDLDSRLGKAPGGYNYPLAKTNMPFIFMNASGNLRDVETLVHEAGHAIHSFQMAPLTLNAYKNTPSEVAELASMSMELLTMNTWDAYFDDKSLLNRAKSEQLEGILGTLPWIAQVDAFQHWIYENPTHNDAERTARWLELCSRYGSGEVDYTDLETALENSWHKQLHIFEVPFYYVEYGFAQLGAVGVWKNYITKGQAAIEDYKAFLKLGNTKSIPNIYETAGVKFEFSESYISDLMQFVKVELAAIHN